MASLGDNLPRDIAAAVRPQLETVLGDTKPGLLTLGAVLALWSATGGTNALIKALNRAWEVEETRPFLVKTGTALGLTVLAGVGIIGSFVSIVGASLLTNEVVARLGLDRSAVDLASLLRWPLVFALLSSAVAVLYHWAPNFRAPWRACLAGGALFSIAWILATWLFALYVANFANYANTYGALGGVIAMMLWSYLSAMLLISAAALVAAALKELRPATVRERRVERGVQSSGAEHGRPSEGAAARSRHTVATESQAVAPPLVAPESCATESRAVGPRAVGPRAVAVAQRAVAVAPPVVRARRARHASAAASYRMSGPEEWAFAGVVAATGVALGALAAWALEPDRRA